MTTPNKNIIVFGSNNFINAVYDNFSIRDFKKSYSWYITLIEWRKTKYMVNPTINGKIWNVSANNINVNNYWNRWLAFRILLSVRIIKTKKRDMLEA